KRDETVTRSTSRPPGHASTPPILKTDRLQMADNGDAGGQPEKGDQGSGVGTGQLLKSKRRTRRIAQGNSLTQPGDRLQYRPSALFPPPAPHGPGMHRASPAVLTEGDSHHVSLQTRSGRRPRTDVSRGPRLPLQQPAARRRRQTTHRQAASRSRAHQE